MRVLHVINSLAAGGAERLISNLVPAMAGHGVECSVFVLDCRADAFSPGMRQAGIRVAFARPAGASPYSPARFFDILREIRREKADIVHAHLGPSFHWCALCSLVARGTIFIATEHASENRRMALPFFRAIERFFHRRFARIACVSDESAAALERWLGKRNFHASVIPNGIATRQFSASVPPAPDIKAWVGTRTALVMTARLVPAKDHVTALGALAFLPEDFCLILVGDGPERRALGAMAMRLGLGRRCLFAGTRKDVPEVLACASIYLQSSRVEGFGIAALEAMAAGLPVVASDAPGLGELVRGAGEIFRVGDAEACAAAIRMLASDTGAMARAKAVGRLRAQEFSIDACAARYARLYLECLEDAR